MLGIAMAFIVKKAFNEYIKSAVAFMEYKEKVEHEETANDTSTWD